MPAWPGHSRRDEAAISDADLAQISTYLSEPSDIAHHGHACCRTALAWMRTIDATHCLVGRRWEPPTWLRASFDWGPVRWPLFWCDIPRADTLDCGALASAALRCFRARGDAAAQVQLALRYPRHALSQWAAMWERSGQACDWIGADACYHEACAVRQGDSLGIWDPSENRWLDRPNSSDELFASVCAIRVRAEGGMPSRLTWQGLDIQPGTWTAIRPGNRGA